MFFKNQNTPPKTATEANDTPQEPQTEEQTGTTTQTANSEDSAAEDFESKWKLALADFANFRKQVEKQRSADAKFGNATVLSAILPIFDNFTLAVQHLPAELKTNNWTQGILAIEQQFREILTSLGLKEIAVQIGENFDPNQHTTVATAPGRPGEILALLAKGYELNGKVLRPARVKVGIAPAPKKLATPGLQELPERQVAFVSFVGDYRGKVEVFATLFAKLKAWAEPQKLITSETVFLASYPNDPRITPPEKLRLELCLTIAQDVSVEAGGEVQQKTLPGGQYAVQSFELKDPQEYGQAWESVVQWAEAQNYPLDPKRPSYEIYHEKSAAEAGEKQSVEICLSVGL